ncbi:hypothetical protein [Variovorax sp. PBL-E5]|uniref:hypothetical protein n=1 Tax=Variovorax sp. PBL-E5 TaxID=434014 RepID=UPI001318A4AD|nr:hypothetical protein [Variovorax sp. PBL-E5]VTU23123.1 Hydroxyneurosporene synthase (CrtC) [Variovorax sp. PBL-E5]
MSTARPIVDPLAFGWYFVDLLVHDGSRFTVAIHGANGFALPRRASVVVWHYRDGAKPQMWVSSGGAAQLPERSMFDGIRNDVAVLDRTPNGWQLEVKSPQFELTLSIDQHLPLWRPPTLPFPLRYESGSASFDWVILCPHGSAQGVFQAGATRIALAGDVYVDANFGTIDVAAELDWWKWSTIDLAPGERVVASTTRWRRDPAVTAAIHIGSHGVQVMTPAQVRAQLGADLTPLGLDAPTAPDLPLASELDLSVLGARLQKYRRWSGRIGGKPAVLALLTA